jgi:zinc D-Ala-D-Ala dipeptidase
MKPYQRIVIHECNEPLVEIPPSEFPRIEPHPYASLGAPYGNQSPFFVRVGVLDRLRQAQQVLDTHLFLQTHQSGWRIQIFDAYRPVTVQQFMVDHSLGLVVSDRGWNRAALTPAQRESALQQVHQFWAKPSLEALTPTPHSTGGAIDVTLVDASGHPINMGGELDEMTVRSYPDHYVGLADPEAERYDRNRQILNYCMNQAGFERHYHEWWHFSWGDQLWAWLKGRRDCNIRIACYGRVE